MMRFYFAILGRKMYRERQTHGEEDQPDDLLDVGEVYTKTERFVDENRSTLTA